MKIMRLALTNFKGIRNFTLDAQGEDMMIRGDNAAGKTTLFDAFLWLLFGKDSQNKSKFDIKTLDENNNAIHGLDHEVEAVLEIGGKQTTLKKSFREKWEGKRGSAEARFAGHTTDFYIDDVPVKQKDYLARVAEIADEGIFKLLTNPRYFNEQIKWEQRREILLEVCGDISDAEVIASDDRLSKLPEIMGDHSLDDFKAMVKAQRKKINDELEKLPVRIDEVCRGLPDIEGANPEQATEKIALLKSSIRKREQAISRIESGGEVAEKTKLLREVEAELQEIKNKHTAKIHEELSNRRKELNVFGSTHDTISKIGNLKRDIEYNNARIESLEEKMSGLREKYKAEYSREFNFEQDENCPTCGQPIPKEQLEEARNIALEELNFQKAEKLQSINTEGKNLKSEAEKLKAENKEAEAKIKGLQKQYEQEQRQVDELTGRITALEQRAEELPAAYTNKLKKKESLETAITGLKGGSQDEKTKLYEQIAALEESMRDAERVLSNIDIYEQGQKRIAELEGQEKKLAAEYARIEQGLFLIEEFTRAKVKMLEEKINSKFRIARFKMFDVLINGGISETCETIIGGVPYSTGLNAGHQTIGGMDIIRSFSKHYGFYPPIFVDNAESVTELPEMKAQVIRLVKPDMNPPKPEGMTDADYLQFCEQLRKKYSKLNVAYASKKLVKEAV